MHLWRMGGHVRLCISDKPSAWRCCACSLRMRLLAGWWVAGVKGCAPAGPPTHSPTHPPALPHRTHPPPQDLYVLRRAVGAYERLVRRFTAQTTDYQRLLSTFAEGERGGKKGMSSFQCAFQGSRLPLSWLVALLQELRASETGVEPGLSSCLPLRCPRACLLAPLFSRHAGRGPRNPGTGASTLR